MIEPLREDRRTTRLDPLDGRAVDFDWDAVDRQQRSPEPQHLAALAEALQALLRHLVARHSNDGANFDRIVGRRAIALAWVVDPGLFEGSPPLAAIARDLGITSSALSAHAAKVSREFGFTNRGQARGWNRRRSRSVRHRR